MSRSDRRPVVAVGIDGAEPAVVRTLMANGELPSLRALAERGAWGRVTSPADIGSGAVWPTFMTGSGPVTHGICYDWPWDAEGMRIARLSTDRLTPFWRTLALEGHTIGVLDVPYGPVPGLTTGVEISEWGSHDWIRGRLTVSPATRTDWVRQRGGIHPFAGPLDASGPADVRGLRRLAAACRDGARARGTLAVRLLAEMELDLLLVVFPEVHKGSHILWHAIDPTHPAHGAAPRDGLGLLDIFREVDRQIGRLAEAAGPDAVILVFSLHGMRARRGVPTILDPLLRALGLAVGREGPARPWPARARHALRAAKGLTPAPVKRLYHRLVPRALTRRVAHQGVALAYDWSRTVAFPLPSDQHGWIRLNLAGREAEGIVEAGRYLEVCTHLERLLPRLATQDGQPVVRSVRRLAGDSGPPRSLPDLVVHWEDAAEAAPLRLKDPAVEAYPTATKFTGQHAPDGFFVWRGRPGGGAMPDPVTAEDLHRVLGDALERPVQSVTDVSGRPLRVLSVIASSAFGGAERVFVSVLKELDPERFQMFVAYHGQGPMADEYRKHAAGLWRLPLTSIFDARSVLILARLMRRLGCEIVHSHLWTADVLAGLAAMVARVPIRLATVGGEYFRSVDDGGGARARKALLSRVHRLAYRPFDRVIAVSRRTAEDLTGRAGIRVDPRKVVTIPNGLDLDRVRSTSRLTRGDLGLPPAAPVLTTVANFVPIKGHRWLLDAMPRILARFPDATLLLAGNGPGLPAVRERVAAAHLGHRVRLLGARADTLALIALSDVIILPSVAAEGLPITILEALALGKPVLATPVGGVPEVIQDGETGVLVAPEDPRAIADGVMGLLADPARAAAMAARGLETVQTRFSHERMARQVEHLYLELALAKGLARSEP